MSVDAEARESEPQLVRWSCSQGVQGCLGDHALFDSFSHPWVCCQGRALSLPDPSLPNPVLLLTVPGMEETRSETDKTLSKQSWDSKKVRTAEWAGLFANPA